MDKTFFDETIFQNWGMHFKSSHALMQQPGTTILPEIKYQGDKIIAIWHIGQHSFAQCDPDYEADLRNLVDGLPANTSLTGDLFRNAWNKEPITSQDIGLVYYLFPPDLPQHSPPEPFSVRQITSTDRKSVV